MTEPADFNYEYGVGTLAYIDTLRSGLVPCKVLEVIEGGGGESTDGKIKVKVTAKRDGFERGAIEYGHASRIIPRDMVKLSGYQIPKVYTFYIWIQTTIQTTEES
jgi:hypothetical protein